MNKTINVAKNPICVIAVRPEYVKFAGANTAVLLSQIVYWFSNNRLRVKRDGRMWLAKTREELAGECGLSLDQYKRAIKRLKDLGLVVVEAHMWNGFRTSYLWLDHSRLAQIAPTSRVESAPTGRSRSYRPITETTNRDYDREQHERASPHEQKRVGEAQEQVREKEPRAIADWVAERPGLAEQRLKTNFTATEWEMKAGEILRRHQKMGFREIRLTTNSLAMQWKRCMSAKYGEFEKDLTKKEIGQLKMYMQKAGHHAPGALRYMFDDWGGVVHRIIHEKGLKGAPGRPNIDFLLKYHDVAINELLQSIASKLTHRPEPKPQPKIVRAPTVEKPKVEEPMATIEDVMAVLAESERRRTKNDWRDTQRLMPGASRRFR
ncbi:MAG: hypothetical protein ACTHL5_02285 [Rhodanobacter sp.]